MSTDGLVKASGLASPSLHERVGKAKASVGSLPAGCGGMGARPRALPLTQLLSVKLLRPSAHIESLINHGDLSLRSWRLGSLRLGCRHGGVW